MSVYGILDLFQLLLRILWVLTAVAGAVFCGMNLRLSKWVSLLLLGFVGQGVTAFGSMVFLLAVRFAGMSGGYIQLFFLGVSVVGLVSHILVVAGLALLFQEWKLRKAESRSALPDEADLGPFRPPPAQGSQDVQR